MIPGKPERWADKGETPARELPQPPPPRPISPTAKVVLALVCAAMVGALAAALFSSDAGDGGEPSAKDARITRAVAFSVCKDFVSDRLRSPGSAKFRNFYEEDGEVSVVGVGDGPYVVRSTVDSHNGFGALIRSTFSCTVTLDRAADRWRLVDINVS